MTNESNEDWIDATPDSLRSVDLNVETGGAPVWRTGY